MKMEAGTVCLEKQGVNSMKMEAKTAESEAHGVEIADTSAGSDEQGVNIMKGEMAGSGEQGMGIVGS